MLELEISKFSRFFLFENLYLTIFQELKKKKNIRNREFYGDACVQVSFNSNKNCRRRYTLNVEEMDPRYSHLKCILLISRKISQ